MKFTQNMTCLKIIFRLILLSVFSNTLYSQNLSILQEHTLKKNGFTSETPGEGILEFGNNIVYFAQDNSSNLKLFTLDINNNKPATLLDLNQFKHSSSSTVGYLDEEIDKFGNKVILKFTDASKNGTTNFWVSDDKLSNIKKVLGEGNNTSNGHCLLGELDGNYLVFYNKKIYSISSSDLSTKIIYENIDYVTYSPRIQFGNPIYNPVKSLKYIYFRGAVGNKPALFRTDGKLGGTVKLKDTGNESPRMFVHKDNVILVNGNQNSLSISIISDKNNEEISLFSNLKLRNDFEKTNIVTLNDKVYFYFRTSTTDELWVSNGSKENTKKVDNVVFNSNYSTLNGDIYYLKEAKSANNNLAFELIKINSITENSQKVYTFRTNQQNNTQDIREVISTFVLEPFDGKVYFYPPRYEFTSLGQRLWRTDGTTEKTQWIGPDINAPVPRLGGTSSLIKKFFLVRDKIVLASYGLEWEMSLDGKSVTQIRVDNDQTNNFVYITQVGNSIIGTGINNGTRKLAVVNFPEVDCKNLAMGFSVETESLCESQSIKAAISFSGGNLPIQRFLSFNNQNPTEVNSSFNIDKAGIYKVFVRDSKGCESNSKTIEISQGTKPTEVSLKSDKLVIKQGESATLSLDFKNGSKIEWYKNNVIVPNELKNTLVVSAEGQYKSKVFSINGCFEFSNILEIKRDQVSTNLTAIIKNETSTTVYFPALVKLSANTGTGFTYQWQKDSKDISGATAATYDAKESGNYSVKITSNGVSVVSNVIVVKVNTPVGIEPVSNTRGINLILSPNPVSGLLSLEIFLDQPNAISAKIMTIDGKVLKSWKEDKELSAHKIVLDVSAYQSEVYLIEVFDGKNKIARKLVKQ